MNHLSTVNIREDIHQLLPKGPLAIRIQSTVAPQIAGQARLHQGHDKIGQPEGNDVTLKHWKNVRMVELV
jgi:hypothetical protein